MDWSGVDYCDVFIRLSFWRHPFTAEHSLLSQWCDANLMKKQTHLQSILDDYIHCYFWVPFNLITLYSTAMLQKVEWERFNIWRVQMQKPLSAVWNVLLKWAFLSASSMFGFSHFMVMAMHRSFYAIKVK